MWYPDLRLDAAGHIVEPLTRPRTAVRHPMGLHALSRRSSYITPFAAAGECVRRGVALWDYWGRRANTETVDDEWGKVKTFAREVSCWTQNVRP